MENGIFSKLEEKHTILWPLFVRFGHFFKVKVGRKMVIFGVKTSILPKIWAKNGVFERFCCFFGQKPGIISFHTYY